MISYAVVGHMDRIVAATELATTLGAMIALDDGADGATANHLKAWQLTTRIQSDWAVVIEDDAALGEDFPTQAAAALATATTPVVSLYLGRGRPKVMQQRIPAALARADREDACWIVDTRVLHAVAVAIRTTYRDDWLSVAPGVDLPPDERLSAWCQLRGHRVSYTVPSLVNHNDWPTLITDRPSRAGEAPRRAWRVGTREHWHRRTVAM